MWRNANAGLLLGTVLLSCAVAAHAERADHDKPIHLEAERVLIDDARQFSVFSGGVVMTQGTLDIRGDQIVVTQGKGGFKHGTVTGQLASFRQKREGLDDYVEGNGERIEYDSASGIMDIFGHAHVRRGQDDVRGDHIVYNPKTEVFQVSGAPETQNQTPEREQRVRVTIQPHSAEAVSAVPAEPLSIKPDTRLIKPGNKP